MKITMDLLSLPKMIPKRGDLLQTNTGDRRERTCMILCVKELRPTLGIARCKIWCERWWWLEADFRMRLHRSAERNGGQCVFYFKRYPAKKRKSFEQLMGAR